MSAHLCVTRALKLADAATAAPLQYALLPWAMLLGWLAFGDVPAAAMLVAAAIIVLVGLVPAWPARRPAARRTSA